MTNVVQFPAKPPIDPEDDWIFSARVMRNKAGRAYIYLEEVCPAEFETNEQAHERMRRLGLLALEAAANMMAVADGMAEEHASAWR